MKALSIKQPWAWLICAGYKDIENRTWHTNFRGRIYVHASKYWDAVNGNELYSEFERPLMAKGLTSKAFFEWWRKENMRTDGVAGEIIGEVTITDCVKDSSSPWAEFGMWRFVLTDPVLYDKPIPYKGQLGFFEVKL